MSVCLSPYIEEAGDCDSHLRIRKQFLFTVGLCACVCVCVCVCVCACLVCVCVCVCVCKCACACEHVCAPLCVASRRNALRGFFAIVSRSRAMASGAGTSGVATSGGDASRARKTRRQRRRDSLRHVPACVRAHMSKFVSICVRVEEEKQ